MRTGNEQWWVSLGYKVTTKSGQLRTVYRNSSTGELRVMKPANKRVVEF